MIPRYYATFYIVPDEAVKCLSYLYYLYLGGYE
ncbi:hypothetical protein CLAFUW4_08083 [Fulvia fulva]|nr:uncharacterized protein CLAFUR5_20248 [Fulvia fulva]XP_059318927.1 uncharacterized protein CLAFUR5_20249 [Fulvia fulva]KAK4628825.1 hypothetical protein CLAFUR4_08086 [Fulvia fulva]KAK4629417.1 hypothetical protein CLAFUR4_08088 [Fulvia fulva]KAK4629860.1 hypothetical protein CLAFUR0_08083 [Fulvia fulva]KAK4630462.1 hypothetical protein CLAFUR0_08081 [Fulvia fulva]WMI38822.1 hypothetical protein CLAFUR5_20248 [Fulvia fulva]